MLILEPITLHIHTYISYTPRYLVNDKPTDPLKTRQAQTDGRSIFATCAGSDPDNYCLWSTVISFI